jgi:hypothetical protein
MKHSIVFVGYVGKQKRPLNAASSVTFSFWPRIRLGAVDESLDFNHGYSSVGWSRANDLYAENNGSKLASSGPGLGGPSEGHEVSRDRSKHAQFNHAVQGDVRRVGDSYGKVFA